MNKIFSAIRPIILRTTGVPECVLANSNKIAVRGEYATVLIAQDTQHGWGTIERKLSDDGRDITITNKYTVTYDLTVNFFRGNAIERASKLMRIQYLPLVSDELLSKGFSIINCSNVMNLTALQSQSFEERSSITLTLATKENVSETVGRILSCGCTVKDEKDKILSTITIGK